MAAGGWRRAFRLETGARRVERDVNEEIAFHIEMRTRKLVASGVAPEAARATAIAQFGDLPGVRDECLSIGHDRERAMKLSDFLNTVRQDAAYAVRSFIKQPGFTLVVVAILALGIGANTATVTLLDALLLRDLPVPYPEQLVSIGDPSATGGKATGSPFTDFFSYPVYADVRDHARTLSGVYATGGTGIIDVREASAPLDAQAMHPRARYVSGSYFNVLQVRPMIGRAFTAAADRAPGAEPVVVISYAGWQRDFGGDSAIVGRRLAINAAIVTVIGVMPPSFTGDIVGSATDLWIPIMMQPRISPTRPWLDDRSMSWLLFMGRLAPGATVAQARAEITPIVLHSILDHATADDRTFVESTLRERPIQVAAAARGFSHYRTSYGPALLVLMAAVTLVMLVVCANVANLMLARSAGRTREISVRMALGAGRWRLVQQLFTECLVLAALAGAAGLGIAAWSMQLLLRIASDGPTPIPLAVHFDGRTIAYTGVVSLITLLIFGVAPAVRATRLELATALRGQGRALNGLGGAPGRFGLGKWLVVAQVALSTVLLVGAGMLIHSATQMATVDLGMDRDHLAVVSVSARRVGYSGARLVALMHDLAERMERIPGVQAASYSENGLFSGTESGIDIRVPGYEVRADSEKYVTYNAVGPGYFHAVGARLLRGRDLNDGDAAGAARVAVLDETAAKFYFGNTDPVGRTFISSDSVYTIVGVVGDVEEQNVRAKPVRRVYFSIFQQSELPGRFRLEVRTGGAPSEFVKAMRDGVLASDRRLAPDIEPVNTLIRQSVGQDRLVTQMVAFFGLLTLVLAALGLYGLMAYATARRTGEFGIRVALGAAPGGVTRMIVGEAVMLTAIGVAVGLPCGLAAARLIRGQLFGVGAVDVPSLALAVAVLLVSAVVASYLPARRASRVGPLEALRAE